ncbi:MAG: hypothetical protein WA796_15830, partial [Pseudolabrys sp.]
MGIDYVFEPSPQMLWGALFGANPASVMKASAPNSRKNDDVASAIFYPRQPRECINIRGLRKLQNHRADHQA